MWNSFWRYFSAISGLFLLKSVADLSTNKQSLLRYTQKCTNPAVRREWRTLSTNDKLEYIRAVKCLMHTPSAKKVTHEAINRFDDFQSCHIKETNHIHFNGKFFSWHRYFVYAYESALRNECGYKGYQPYWDFTLDSGSGKEFLTSPVLDPITGFGGNGPFVPGNGTPGQNFPLKNRTGGGCVQDGPFKDTVLHFNGNSTHNCTSDCIRRDFVPYMVNSLTKKRFQEVLSEREYLWFDFAAEGRRNDSLYSVHAAGHFIFGGTLGSNLFSSPGDPLFYLHHSNIDRLWWAWQKRNPEKRLREIAGPTNNKGFPHGNVPSDNVTLETLLEMGGLVPNLNIANVMDTKSGPFCYEYATDFD